MGMDNQVRICDCTLRQTKEFPELSFREKLELCKLVDRLNPDLIEMDEIRNRKIDSLLIKSVSSAVRSAAIAVPVSLNAESVQLTWEALKEAVRPRLQVSVPVSSVQMEYLYHVKAQKMIQLITDTISLCRERTEDVEFIAQDATRSDPVFLREILSAAVKAGANTVTVCDTAGSMLPEETADFIRGLRTDVPELSGVVLGYFASNQLSLADACAVAAVRSGVRELKAAAFRTDAISLSDVVRILNVKASAFGIQCRVGTEQIRNIVSRIQALCTEGMSRFPAAEKSQTDSGETLSAHDSRESIQKAVSRLGYDLSEEDMNRVWGRFSAVAERKGSVSLRELDAIIATEAMQVPPAYHNVHYVISVGNEIGAMAHLKMQFHDQELEGISTGDGSIASAFNSIEQATGRHFDLDDFQIQSIAEGREAMGETIVKLRSEGKLYSGRGISTDIVGAGIMAYINALNKIVYEEEEA